MDARTLADDYLAFRRETDVWANLWAGDMTHLEAWDDPSPEGTAATVARYVDFRDRATALAADANGDDRALLGTIAATAEVSRLTTDLDYDIDTPNPETGLLGYLLPFLPRYRLQTVEDGERYLEKLERFPEFAAGMAARMEQSCAVGVNPLRSHAERLETLIAARIDDPSHWYAQPGPDGFEDWDGRLRAAVDGPLVEGLRVYAAGLAACPVPNGRGDDRAGLMHIPDGASRYDALVKAHTTLDVSAEEVHQIGLQQVDRLADEYREIAGPLLGTTDVSEILERLREDPALHYSDAASIVADALAALDRAVAESDKWFASVPEAGCDGVAIDGGALAFYSRPKSPGARGTFFFNTSDPTVWTTFGLEAIAYHESVPGHHFQIARAVEDPTLHECQTRLYVAAFNEGWGLYSERLSDEMGLYTSDLARVGMLQADSMRACRLVVDTGMHALGWSRQQAIDYMVANSPMNRPEVTAEVDRYITAPGQALGYMIGRLEIDKARRWAEGELGDRFDIKGFHEALLGAGTITLATMRERVESWVAAA